MTLYERFVTCPREKLTSLTDAQARFRPVWPEKFNFAYDALDALALESPDALAILYVSNEGKETRVSFADVKRMSDKAANMFARVGVRKGDRVLLVLRRSLYFWYCMMGLSKLGAVAVQATHMLMAKDYSYRCDAAGVKCAVITGDCLEIFESSLPDMKEAPVMLSQGRERAGWLSLEGEIDASDDTWDIPTGDAYPGGGDPLLLLFSSGTSGYPKMIQHDHTYPLGHIATALLWQRVEKGGLHFTISDTGWGKSLWGKLYGQWLGESAVLVYDFDKFNGADVLAVISRCRVTTFCAPPTMYRMMLLEDVSKYDLSSIKHCCTAGEALTPEVFYQWRRATGLSIYEGFGQTETALTLGTLYPWSQPVPGALGKPVPGWDVCLLSPDGRPCEPGVSGEICLRAPSRDVRPRGLMRCYFRNEEATEHAWHEGFYHTGDVAYQDEMGLFHYVGRNDDVIKSSGYRIGPFEVESVLMEHPAVLEAAVTGVPDPVRGFSVKATICLAPGYSPSDELIRELQTFVKRNTAPYKYPRVVEFVDELPKTVSGKIRRVAIRDKDMAAYRG